MCNYCFTKVTQVNLRNLLFGRYLPSESGGSQYQEVQGFDQYERIVQENIKKNNEKSPQEVVNILPIRYICKNIRWPYEYILQQKNISIMVCTI